MTEAELQLLVIRSQDIDSSAEFYRSIGVDMVEEQHGNGPRHFAAELGRLVFEVYPLGKSDVTSGARLTFAVDNLEIVDSLPEEQVIKAPSYTDRGYLAVVKDPDGHTIELTQNIAHQDS